MATASFIGEDTTTQGSWIGVYGADGYHFPATLADSNPAYVTGFDVNRSDGANADEFQWGIGSETRRLQNPADPTGNRYGITWYDSSAVWIELLFDVGATTRRVALYFLDDDASGRADDVDVYDADTATLLDSQSVSSFSQGKWLVWDVTGNLRIRITLTTIANPTLSAVMWHTPSAGGTTTTPGIATSTSSVIGASTRLQNSRSPIQSTSASISPLAQLLRAQNPITLIDSVIASAKSIEHSPSPITTTSSPVGGTQGIGSTQSPVGSTGSADTFTTKLDHALTPIQTVGTVPQVITGNVTIVTPSIATSLISVVAMTQILEHTIGVIEATDSLIAPNRTLTQTPTLPQTVGIVPSVTLLQRMTVTPEVAISTASIVGLSTRLVYAFSPIVATTSVPAVTIVQPTDAPILDIIIDFPYMLSATLDFPYTLEATLDFPFPD